MANYYLYVLSADEIMRKIIKRSKFAGAAIADSINRFDMRGNGTAFPPRSDKLDSDLYRAFVKTDLPKPEPIVIGEKKVGEVLGRYYDGNPVGAYSLPVKIPPDHYVFTAIDYDTLTEGYLTKDSLCNISGARIVKLMDEFDRDPDDNCRINVIRSSPVFVNRSDKPVDFCIIKRTPFREEDAHLIENCGGPYNMPASYKPPRMA